MSTNHVAHRTIDPTVVIWRHLEQDYWKVTVGSAGAGKDFRLVAVKVSGQEPVYVSNYAPALPASLQRDIEEEVTGNFVPVPTSEGTLAWVQLAPQHPPFRDDITYPEMLDRVQQHLGRDAGPYLTWLTEDLTEDLVRAAGLDVRGMVHVVDGIVNVRRQGLPMSVVRTGVLAGTTGDLRLHKLEEHLDTGASA